MKMQRLSIQINNPCYENWDSMDESQYGKFCSSCSKNVTDFTRLSDKELVRVINNSTDNLCGRFYKNQLDRCIHGMSSNSSFHRFFKFIYGFLFLTSANTILAQDSKPETTIRPSVDNATKSIESANTSILTSVLTGKVVNSKTMEACIGVVVALQNGDVKTYTDTSGYFSLTIPDTLEIIKFSVSWVGYHSKYFSISKADLQSVKEIYLQENLVVTGEYVVYPAKKEKKIKNVKGRLFFE